jgi:leucyl aminopeptidase
MIKLVTTDPTQMKTNLLVIAACRDADVYEHPRLVATIQQNRRLSEFSGNKKEDITLYQPAGYAAERLMIVGLGELRKLEPEALRATIGKAIGRAIQKKLSNVAIAVPGSVEGGPEFELLFDSMLEGACLANHRFDRYKSDNKIAAVKQISFIVPEKTAAKHRRRVSRTEAICAATLLARDWVNTPANDKTPQRFAATVMRLSEKTGLKTKLLRKKELKRQKFGAILAVAAGSQSEPALLMLEHAPEKIKKTIALVGKGVTFDSGGLNLKTNVRINQMKADMAGAAAVAATMLCLSRLKPDLRVVGVIPLVENMISGEATRPGDIIRTYSGKTVEIGNTDAEGRLVLADAISYAIKKYRPQILIDIATLTGACVVALGEELAGLFSSDDPLAEAILQSSEQTHERCWRMPLTEDYRDLLKSEVADINNMPRHRFGAAISAALFLSEFANGTRWAHLDIAGPAFHKKASDYCGPGATGFGVRLLCEVVLRLDRAN